MARYNSRWMHDGVSPVSKVESIEREIERLDDESFAAFRAWFIEYENSRWDRQIKLMQLPESSIL